VGAPSLLGSNRQKIIRAERGVKKVLVQPVSREPKRIDASRISPAKKGGFLRRKAPIIWQKVLKMC